MRLAASSIDERTRAAHATQEEARFADGRHPIQIAARERGERAEDAHKRMMLSERAMVEAAKRGYFFAFPQIPGGDG